MIPVPGSGTSIKARYSADDLTMLALRTLGINSPQAVIAKQWILSMTPTIDGEDGAAFWQWVVNNHQNARSDSICDSFLFIENTFQTVVATASIVLDDRSVGVRHAIEGVWLGGLNVRQQFRGHGMGTLVVQLIHAHIQAWAQHRTQNIRVNLFTDNPAAMRIYERAGYQRLGVLVVDECQMAMFYSRTFSARLESCIV
jgi:RimJ/RimL family protein N-acetyltransferase